MTQRIDVAVGVIVDNDNILIAKRAAHLHQGDKWEFPGGKIEAGESVDVALIRELDEELNIRVTHQKQWFSLQFDYPEKQVNLHMNIVTNFAGEPIGREGQPLKWVPISELNNYTFPDANKPILQKLLAGEY